MTVHHYGEEVEIVGGSAKEGWAIIEYDDGEITDVPLSELKAGNPTAEIYNPEVYEDGQMDYSQHLPLKVEQGERDVRIRTNNDEILYEVDLKNIVRNSRDEYKVDEVSMAVQWVRWAYEMPKRVLWRLQDELLEVEA